MNQKSFELWKRRIADMKASGLKVTDWCEKNNLTKHAYYYWLKRIENTTQKPDAPTPVFVEIEPTYITPRQTVKADLQIIWNDINLTISDSDTAKLAGNLSASCRNYVRSLCKGCFTHIYFLWNH